MKKTEISDLRASAIRFASRNHSGQLYDNGLPFLSHPSLVADIITVTAPSDENLIAAAWLHDVLEDTQATYQQLVTQFGHDIADLVREVTHAGTDDQKGYYFPLLKSRRGIQLKFADRLANISHMEAWEPDKVDHYLKKSKFWRSEI